MKNAFYLQSTENETPNYKNPFQEALTLISAQKTIQLNFDINDGNFYSFRKEMNLSFKNVAQYEISNFYVTYLQI